MTTIILSKEAKGGRLAVFGNHEAPDGSDRYTFGFRWFDATDGAKAEAHARRMMEVHGADHFERS